MTAQQHKNAHDYADTMTAVYPQAFSGAANPDLIRHLVALAYSEGCKDGAETTVGVLRVEAEKLIAELSAS